MGTQGIQMKGALLWLVCWACADIVGPVHISSPYTFSVHLSPSSSKLGQAVVVGHLSFYVCLSNLQPMGAHPKCLYVVKGGLLRGYIAVNGGGNSR